ncbi:MAG: DNA translocase FtsK [Saprospiraceae bacterium]|nr:DNA translocase FtsK [Saprospiraceae bacterium]
MASKNKKEKPASKPKTDRSVKIDRARKFVGLALVLGAVYLAIAFTSYMYTWKYDQDVVLQFTWSSFFKSDLIVENWLGRFGAYISNAFFYWGFGLPSILFVLVLLRLGIDMLKRKSLVSWLILTRNIIVLTAFLSLLLEFTFRNSSFTWGGAFGESTCFWLTNFMGTIGLFFLLFFTIGAFFVWKYNFSFDQIPALNMSVPGMSFIANLTEKVAGSITDSDIDADEEEVAKEPKAKGEKAKAESLKPTGATLELNREDIKDKGGSILDFVLPEPVKRPVFDRNSLEMEIDNTVEAVPKTDADEFVVLDDLSDDDINIAQNPSLNDVIREKTVEDVLDGEPYDPTLDLRNYKFPTLEMLEDYNDGNVEIDREELEGNKDQIISTLLNYKIEIIKIRATIGPTVTLYEIVPAPGVKISKIKNLEDDIALSLSALGIRIIAPIPGKGTIGIEVPNKNKQTVSLKEVLSSEKFQTTNMALPIALGKTISNEVFVADLAKMPHLLIAGATGQGKSVGINTVLMSLLYKKHPSQVKLVLVDPKKVELFPYAALEQHFLSFLPNEEEPILTETSKVIYTLNSLCIEMDSRYDLLKAAKVRNLKEYNEKFTERRLNPRDGHKFMPYIVLVIDEFADLIMTAGKEVEMPIARLAQLARAVGIHLIIATQRPSVNIITGIIKANFPARIAFKVTSKIDSRTILDAGGADQLIGRGDMLLSIGSSAVRLQCAFVDTPEVEKVIDFISSQPGFPEPFYLPEYKGDENGGNDGSVSLDDLDDMFEEAAKIIVSNQHGSTSMIQRKLQLGYNRAGRIMDQMEKLGIVGPAQGSKPREVLFYSVDELQNFMDTLRG